MKKVLLLILVLVLGAPARASVLDALEACRTETGLLPDAPDGGYSSKILAAEMKLRLLLDDRKSFDKLYRLMVKYFQSPMLLLYCRLDASLKPVAYENNIAVELQVCRVLLEAFQRWQVPEYHRCAIKKAGRLLRYNVYRNVLINSAQWKERPSGIYSIYEPSHVLDLCSVDVLALQLLKNEMPHRWESVAQRCLGILLAGSGTFEMQRCYDVDKLSYVYKNDSLAALRIMENLVDGGLVPRYSMERLAARLQENPRFLADEETGSLEASSIGGYVLSQAGYSAEARQVFAALEETYGTGEEGLLCAPGKTPSIFENLVYLTEKAKLAPQRLK
ncbi:MAG: hypothetical protein ACOYD9_01540 [Pyramidobacter sp.]